MKKKLLVLLGASALVLTACGGSTDGTVALAQAAGAVVFLLAPFDAPIAFIAVPAQAAVVQSAAPIQAAVRDGCAETGVTIMRMVPALDAGPAILTLATPIAIDETAGELQLRLSELGAAAIVEALALLSVGAAPEHPQDDALATYARKIERADARVDFSHPATRVACAIRAYDPKPGAWAVHRDGEVRLFGAMLADATGVPGTILSASPSAIVHGQTATVSVAVSTGDGSIATGTVAVSDGTSPVGSCSLTTGGACSITAAALSTGTHTLAASYSGDALRYD